MAQLISYERAHTLFEITEKGELIWRQSTNRRVVPGDVAGSMTSFGYRCVRADGRLYQAHRLVWLMVHGHWPVGELDHINGVKTDNRPANLRDVSQRINRQNVRSAKRTSRTGVLGVAPYGVAGDRYQANLSIEGRKVWLGSFETVEEASKAYVLAKRLAHEGCTL